MTILGSDEAAIVWSAAKGFRMLTPHSMAECVAVPEELILLYGICKRLGEDQPWVEEILDAMRDDFMAVVAGR